jgi:hypothetical protein
MEPDMLLERVPQRGIRDRVILTTRLRVGAAIGGKKAAEAACDQSLMAIAC